MVCNNLKYMSSNGQNLRCTSGANKNLDGDILCTMLSAGQTTLMDTSVSSLGGVEELYFTNITEC